MKQFIDMKMFNEALYLSIISFLILIPFLIYQIFFVYRKKKKIFSTKKIVMMGIFFAIFIFQSLLTLIQSSDGIFLIDFDSATVIVVSFLFGPLEGFLYGILADNTRLLILGWPWQLLYALKYPIISLIAGTLGQFYEKHKQEQQEKNIPSDVYFYKKRITYYFIFQAMFMFIYIYWLTVGFINPTQFENNSTIAWNSAIISVTLLIIVYQLIFWTLILLKKYKDIDLIIYLFFISIFYRYFLSIIYDSVADVNLWAPTFGSVFIPRLIKSIYIVPLNTVVWFFLIKILNSINKEKNF